MAVWLTVPRTELAAKESAPTACDQAVIAHAMLVEGLSSLGSRTLWLRLLLLDKTTISRSRYLQKLVSS
jgi:hypothetical protein